MPRMIAIDLGTHAAKVSVYRQAGRRSELEGQYAALVPQSGEAPPALSDRLMALDDLVDEHPEWTNPSNEIGLVWPLAYASVRHITLPFTDRSQVDKTLPFSVEGEVPFDLEDMQLVWRPLSVDTETRALVTLLRRDRLEQWLNALAERGLDPKNIHLDGEILGRWVDDEQGTAAVIDVGHEHTVLAVVHRGRVVATRSIDVGGRHFTRAIAEALDCSWDEAEARKHGNDPSTPGDTADLPPAAREAAESQMGLLLAEVRTTLIAVEDERGLEVQRVLLTGGGARLDPLASYLAEDLGLSLQRIHDAEQVAVDPAFAAAYGLNMVQAHGAPKDALVQLRTGEFSYKGGVNVLRAVAVYGSAALAFFLVAVLVVFAVQYRNLSAEQAHLEERIESIVTETFPDVSAGQVQNSTTALAIMSERTQLTVQRADILASASRPPTMHTLYELTEAFPPPEQVTVTVEDLTITPTTITFNAETDGYASAARVEEALQGHPRFSEAAKSGDRKIRDQVEFNVSIPLGENAEGEEG